MVQIEANITKADLNHLLLANCKGAFDSVVVLEYTWPCLSSISVLDECLSPLVSRLTDCGICQIFWELVLVACRGLISISTGSGLSENDTHFFLLLCRNCTVPFEAPSGPCVEALQYITRFDD